MSTTFKANVQDATINNNLTVDTNTLFVDAANNGVGVGTLTVTTGSSLTVNGKSDFKDILGLAKIATDSLPSAASYEGYAVYDDTTNELKFSNGSAWLTPGGVSIGGTVTSGTTGSVLFIGASSALSQNNSQFFWDNTNNRLGLGTTTPNSPLQISPVAVTTQATGYTSAINLGGSFTKNDSNVRTFQVLNISPTMNFGGSNASTTVDILKIDNTLTSTTGLTLNLAKFATAGTNRAIMDISGHLSINAAGAVAPTVPLDITRGTGTAGVIGKFTATTNGNTNAVEITANSITTEWGTASTGSLAFFGTKSGSNTPLVFRINGTETARLDTDGYFGVGVDPFRRLTIQGSEEFLATFRSTGTKAKHTFDTTGGSFNSYVDLGVDTNISANTGGFGSYIFTGTDSGHATFGTGDGSTSRPTYLKVDGDAVVKIDTDRRMKLANALVLGPLTTGNRNALGTLQNGEIIWNTTNTKTEVYTGSAGWIAVAMENTAAPCVLSFGATSTANTDTTEYIWPGYGSAASATEIGIVIPTTGLISRLFIKAGTGPTGDSIVFTVRKNGTDQALTATLAAAATTANNTVNGFSVTSGDEITIKCDPGVSISAGAVGLRISVIMTVV